MIYELLIVFSTFFMTAPLEMVALITSQIYLMIYFIDITNTVKPVLGGHSKRRQKIGLQDQLLLNTGQKYCRMKHSAILLTLSKLPFVLKIFVLSIFEWRLKTGFTVLTKFMIKLAKNLNFCAN